MMNIQTIVDDTVLYYNLLKSIDLKFDDEVLLQELIREVEFVDMKHLGGVVPRRVAVQADNHIHIDEETGESIILEPMYRHPTDTDLPVKPFSASVARIKAAIESSLLSSSSSSSLSLSSSPSPSCSCPSRENLSFNHCLVQLYRGGQDFISEHADKTLDLARDSVIVNYSLGATRAFQLRPKRASRPVDQPTLRMSVDLPSDSILVFGPESNRKYVHGIKEIKSKGGACGARISLTFRVVTSFRWRRRDGRWGLFGQGARVQTLPRTLAEAEDDRAIASSDEEEGRLMLQAFSAENRSASFDWGEVYGRGFGALFVNLSGI